MWVISASGNSEEEGMMGHLQKCLWAVTISLNCLAERTGVLPRRSSSESPTGRQRAEIPDLLETHQVLCHVLSL